MDDERRARVDSLLEEALSRTDLERAAFLAKTCGEDKELGREVSSLVRCHERAGSFLLTPESVHDISWPFEQDNRWKG